MEQLYLDHAATSWPKPNVVKEAMMLALEQSGNPGRSGHSLSLNAARLIHQARHTLAQFFNAPSSAQIVFTLNATDSLNMAIKGMVKPGDHVITTCLEHNSVLRPLYALKNAGQIELTVLELQDGTVQPEQFAAAIRPDTALVVTTHASNVIGAIIDIASVSRICQKAGVRLLLDAAQTAGVLPIDVQELNLAAMACAGHKGLLGPQGTGALYVRADVELGFWREGGTGSISHEVYQPPFMPDRLEAGTPNTIGIAGLGASVKYLSEIGIDTIRQKEAALTEQLRAGLKRIPGLTLYTPDISMGVFSVNLEGFDSAGLSVALEREHGILTRPGLHCAPLAHKAIGTYPQGTTRISIGYSTTEAEVEQVIKALEELSRQVR